MKPFWLLLRFFLFHNKNLSQMRIKRLYWENPRCNICEMYGNPLGIPSFQHWIIINIQYDWTYAKVYHYESFNELHYRVCRQYMILLEGSIIGARHCIILQLYVKSLHFESWYQTKILKFITTIYLREIPL